MSLRQAFEKTVSTSVVLALLVGAAVVASTLTTTGGITAGTTVTIGGSSGPQIISGSNAPTGTAPRGSLYLRTGADAVAAYQNTDGATSWSQVPSGTPSLSTPTSTNKAFSTNQSECNAALSTVGTHEWLSFLTGGWGSTNSYFGRGLNPVPTSTSNSHVKRSSRLATGMYFIGSFTGSSVGIGTISVSSVASDDATNTGMAATAFSVELVSNSPGYGFGFDVPMMANESGTITMCLLHNSYGFTVSASFGDGSVTPTSLAVANFDPSGGAAGVSLITIPFANGANGGNRLRVQVVASGTRAPFNASLDLGYIYW